MIYVYIYIDIDTYEYIFVSMARRSGGSNKTVEEKRRNLPIYQHYTLSPGKTKSHHPEAKCNHCLKEFVCGSKQRLIRHLRKCDSITNSDEIIADTLNTLARNSATGQLNHSILEASNLLPSQVSQFQQSNHPQNHIVTQHLPGTSTSTNLTTANSNIINNGNGNMDANTIVNNHNTSGSSSNDTIVLPTSSNGSLKQITAGTVPGHKPHRRGRKPANQSMNAANTGIQVTTGIDGKAHFAPISQLSTTISNPGVAPLANNGRSMVCHRQVSLSTNTVGPATHHLNANSGQMACATANQHAPAFKLNSESIDKAYLKLVLTRNLPLSLCDTKEFQSWVRTFGNDYKPPSSISLITQNLENEAQIAQQKISNILVKAPKKTINLELQTWQEEPRGHLWFAIIASTDQRRFLVSVKDIFPQMYRTASAVTTTNIAVDTSRPETALADFIDECVKRLGSDRINSLMYPYSITDDTILSSASQLIQTSNPSVITYECWWSFTNHLCSDVVENNESFLEVLRYSKRLVNFIQARPKLGLAIERYKPFIGITGAPSGENSRWHTHLVCYLLSYIRNNRENIIRILEAHSTSPIQSLLMSDNNNNTNNNISGRSNNNNNEQGDALDSDSNQGTQQQHASILCQQDDELDTLITIVKSSDFWTNLNSALVFLKPLHNIVALASFAQPSTNQNIRQQNDIVPPETPPSTLQISPTFASGLLLSDYANWFLCYGKKLLDEWRESPDSFKFNLVGRYLSRYKESFAKFKLAFAAYLLNPKYRCAYMTRLAKEAAIEEILNIASEFMTEESDGVTIFDQWKLYLNREEPYDMAYDENRSTPFEWWMSLPCAESIRRVAMRILRLRAFSLPKSEKIFSQLYLHEDETGSALPRSSFEQLAVLRSFYDHEDKVGQSNSHNMNLINSDSNAALTNGYSDRSEIGRLHSVKADISVLPADSFNRISETNGHAHNDISHNSSYSSSDVVLEHYSSATSSVSNMSIGDHPGYGLFAQYVDYTETGVTIVEEPTEKKRRKWTAQEILSKCQSNHQVHADLKTK